MKRINIKRLFALAVAGFLLGSCYQKFDPASYAPPLSINGYSSSGEIARTNLIGYWSFNNTLADSVSNAVATNVGTSFGAGVVGQALQGANNAYLLVTPGSAITGMHSFTIAFWVNSPAPSNGIIGLVNLSNTTGFWGNIDMFFENGSTVAAAIFKVHITNGTNETWIVGSGLPNVLGKWSQLTVSYDATSETFKLYANGSLNVTQHQAGYGPLNFINSGKMVFGTVQFQTTPSLTSGSGSQGWASFLTGQLDEVRIYNRALTDIEVSAMVALQGRGK